MTDKVERPAAKKKLKNLDFSSGDAHIALVSVEQGGPASGHDYSLVLKSLNQVDQQVANQEVLLVEQAEEGLTEAVTKVKESGKSKVKPSNVNMEKSMTNEVVDAPVVPQVEMVEKSVLSSIEKALEDNKMELQKALDELNAFKEEKKQAVIKSKTKQVVDIVKDEKVNSILVKAALSLESEDDFSAFIAAITAMQNAVVNAPMFLEQGVNTQKQEVQKSAIDALIDKKYSK